MAQIPERCDQPKAWVNSFSPPARGSLGRHFQDLLPPAWPLFYCLIHSLFSLHSFSSFSTYLCPRSRGFWRQTRLANFGHLRAQFAGQGRDIHLETPFQSPCFEGSAQELMGTQKKPETWFRKRSVREGFLEEVT